MISKVNIGVFWLDSKQTEFHEIPHEINPSKKRGGFAWVTVNTGSHDVATSTLIKNVKAKIKENTNWKDDKTIYDLVFSVLRILH